MLQTPALAKDLSLEQGRNISLGQTCLEAISHCSVLLQAHPHFLQIALLVEDGSSLRVARLASNSPPP